MTEKIDGIENYDEIIKGIIEDEGDEVNTRVETEEENTEEQPEESSEKELQEASEETTEEEESKILGKTPEEIDEIVNKKTQEAVQKHENSLKDYYEAQKNEATINAQIGQVEQSYEQHKQYIAHVKELFQNGEITPEQYQEAIDKAVSGMHQLEREYNSLQEYNKQITIPKVKRVNDEYYQKLTVDLPELKDPIIKKYAENLKEKIYDIGGIDLAKGGFVDYVRDFIAPIVRETEIRGYQKIKNEIQKNTAKAKAKAAALEGNSVQVKTSIQTADDVLNASREDWLNYVLK